MPDPQHWRNAEAAASWLVEFSWGDPVWPGAADGTEPEGGLVRWTDASAPVAIASIGTFAPAPVRVTPQRLEGGVQTERFDVSLPQALPPAGTVLLSTHPPVTVRVWSCDPDDADASLEERFWGQIEESSGPIAAPQGRRSMRCASVKRAMRVGLGVLVSPEDQAAGIDDAMSGLDAGLYTFSGTVLAVAGDRLQMTLLGTQPTVNGAVLGPAWARFGQVSRGGLALGVVDHDGEWARCEQPPPAAWVGETVAVLAGSDRRLETVRDRLNNEERFTGIGVAMPERNRIFEP